MTADVLLAARGLARFYGKRQVLFGIDIALARGEILGLLGQNGAGKSTTLQILCGALGAHAGSVHIAGHDLARAPVAAKRMLGYLPEVPPLYFDLSVDDYLNACARLRAVAADARASAVSRARHVCGLSDVGKRLIGHLSKGYQQRVGLAQAIVHTPAVVVLDEPSAGLDPAQQRELRTLIATLGRQCAVLLSTHILHEVRAIASRIAILDRGRIVHDARVLPASLRVAFISDPGPDALAHLPGVRSVRAAHVGWSLDVDEPATAAARIATHAVNLGWGLRELEPDYDDLEYLFMRLTSGGSEARAA